MNLPLIPVDKANHFIYGFVIFFAANLFLSSLIALIIVLVFGIGKEVYDYKSYGKFDIADTLATVIPAVMLYTLTQL